MCRPFNHFPVCRFESESLFTFSTKFKSPTAIASDQRFVDKFHRSGRELTEGCCRFMAVSAIVRNVSLNTQ
jgi:hypothetical protein